MSNKECKLRDKLKTSISADASWKFRTLYIWGTGNTALLYQEGLGRLQDAGMEFAGYVDNNNSGGGYFAENLFMHQIFCGLWKTPMC